jgi:hypothetical protein
VDVAAREVEAAKEVKLILTLLSKPRQVDL